MNGGTPILTRRDVAVLLSIEAAVDQLEGAALQSDMCVTCAPSRQFYLGREHIAPGTFVAAVGADNEDKQELDPTLLAESKVVADVVGQCATIGELHHALDQKVMTKDQVHAELGEVVAARKPDAHQTTK